MISLFIPDRPAPWQRRVHPKRGKPYTPEPYASWREYAQTLMQNAMSRTGLEITSDYVRLDLVVYLADRKHGDIDNYEKAVNDSAEGIILKNDKQVVSVSKTMVLRRGAPGIWLAYRVAELREVEMNERIEL